MVGSSSCNLELGYMRNYPTFADSSSCNLELRLHGEGHNAAGQEAVHTDVRIVAVAVVVVEGKGKG